MEQKIYHGSIKSTDLAQSLIAHFNRGNYIAQQVGSGARIAVQIATRPLNSSGGQTALSVSIQDVADGVMVQVGKQAWFGVAASLGTTALSAFRNPLSLLGRLDDIAQDIESLRISEDAWFVIDATVQAAGASYQLSERLRRLECDYCGTANPIDQPRCLACGAPMGGAQPRTCSNCGFVVTAAEKICPNCKANL